VRLFCESFVVSKRMTPRRLSRDADDELVHRAVVTVTEDHGTTVPPARRAKKASECLRRILSWRRDVRADGIVHERLPLTPREFHQRWPVFLAGEDAHGHPVAYERVKDVDAEALLAAMDAEDVIRHRVQIMEALSAHKRRARSRGSNPKPLVEPETEAACPSRGALSITVLVTKRTAPNANAKTYYDAKTYSTRRRLGRRNVSKRFEPAKTWSSASAQTRLGG
jgi:hypothetical protein